MSADCKGFTLLEVLVALTILGTAVVIILQLFSANIRAVSASEDYIAASVAGEARIRQLLDDTNLRERTWSESREDGYRMDVAVSETMKEKTGHLSVKLLQIDLTVHWKRGSRGGSIQLKTIKMVDRQESGGIGQTTGL